MRQDWILKSPDKQGRHPRGVPGVMDSPFEYIITEMGVTEKGFQASPGITNWTWLTLAVNTDAPWLGEHAATLENPGIPL